MHTCTCRKYILLSTYKDIQNILSTTHIHFLERILTYMLKVLYQNYICSYPNHLLPQTTHTHLKYFINIQIFVVPFLFIHICTSESQSHVMHTLAFERNFHAIYLLLRGNSTSYIHLGSILVPSWHGYIFLKASYATYPPIYIFWNTLFTIIHFARYFYAIYIYTYIYTPLKSIFYVT